MKSVAEADGVNVEIYVEQEPGSGGKESAEGSIRNLDGFTTRADKPTGSQGNKEKRADPYSVQVNNGAFQLLLGDWNYAFIEEHRFFPYSTYKDQCDASSGAYNKLVGKKIARVIR
jgi:predicted phage terminase large subunit-like protein